MKIFREAPRNCTSCGHAMEYVDGEQTACDDGSILIVYTWTCPRGCGVDFDSYDIEPSPAAAEIFALCGDGQDHYLSLEDGRIWLVNKQDPASRVLVDPSLWPDLMPWCELHESIMARIRAEGEGRCPSHSPEYFQPNDVGLMGGTGGSADDRARR